MRWRRWFAASGRGRLTTRAAGVSSQRPYYQEPYPCMVFPRKGQAAYNIISLRSSVKWGDGGIGARANRAAFRISRHSCIDRQCKVPVNLGELVGDGEVSYLAFSPYFRLQYKNRTGKIWEEHRLDTRDFPQIIGLMDAVLEPRLLPLHYNFGCREVEAFLGDYGNS